MSTEWPNLRERSVQMGDSWQRRKSGLYLPGDLPGRDRFGGKPIAVDLFCGCGGFSCGFISAGFRVVAAADNDPFASLTYMTNLGTYPIDIRYVEGDKDKGRLDRALSQEMDRQAREEGRHAVGMPLAGQGWIKNEPGALGVPVFWFGDVRKLSGKMILDSLDLEPGDIDCVIGGPPCQGFSTAGHRDVMDPRNSLVFEFARLVAEIRPATMVMENVPAMASMVTPEGEPVVDALCSMLERGGIGSREALKKALLGTSGVGYAHARAHSANLTDLKAGAAECRGCEKSKEGESPEQLALAF